MPTAAVAVPPPGETVLTPVALGELDVEGLFVDDDERLSRGDVVINDDTEAVREKAALAESEHVTVLMTETVAVADGEAVTVRSPVKEEDAEFKGVIVSTPDAVTESVI